MDKIICILEKGFSKIALPNGEVITIESCDDGCFITTKNIEEDIKKINKYIGLPIYEVALDNNNISKGFKLGECKITKHSKYDDNYYDCIFWHSISIIGDNMTATLE